MMIHDVLEFVSRSLSFVSQIQAIFRDIAMQPFDAQS